MEVGSGRCGRALEVEREVPAPGARHKFAGFRGGGVRWRWELGGADGPSRSSTSPATDTPGQGTPDGVGRRPKELGRVRVPVGRGRGSGSAYVPPRRAYGPS